MNTYQKFGTLFETHDGNIVPCKTVNHTHQKLANRLPYIPSGDRSQNFKSKF